MIDLKLEVIDDLGSDSIFSCFSSKDRNLFSPWPQFTSKKQYIEWLDCSLGRSIHDFFTIKYNSRIIGFVYDYEFSLRNGNCKITLYIDDEHRNFGLGALAGMKFVSIIFDKYPLKKIYSTVYDYNENSLKSNINAGFHSECILKDYRYYNGRYHSLHFLSLSRDEFNMNLRGTLERMHL